MQFQHGSQSHYQRPAKQSKITSQREYRIKEGDRFQELREVIHSVTGETPQTRRDILKKAAELLRHLSREHATMISRHESLSPLVFSSELPYGVDEGSYTSYEPLVIPNETWTRNSSPMSDTSTTNSMLEYQGHPQAEIHHVGVAGNWDLVQPTPSQFQQTSFSAQWNDPSLFHPNIDQVPYYVESVGVN